MTSIEFIQFIDSCIKTEMLLGPNKNEHRLIGLRNIKSDFNYLQSKNTKLEALDILKKLYKEREENENLYRDAGKSDLWLQEHTEKEILSRWIPKEPSSEEVLNFLSTLTDISRTKSSFKKYQTECIKHFGQKVDSNIILEFISGN